MLSITHHLPHGLLTTPATHLYQILDGPTLCHLPGINPQPLFVSVLLHGDETTGLVAIQQLLTRYSGRPLPRALSLLIGNVEAARLERRHLEGQPDYNRIWCGEEEGEAFTMAGEVLREMACRDLFAAVDIHNNSAPNPHYAMIPRLDPPNIALARLFCNKLVFFLQPHSAQSSAFGEICPATTLECGLPGHLEGLEASVRFLDLLLNMEQQPLDPGPMETLELYQIMATLKIPDSCSFGFDEKEAVCFMVDPPRQNFQIMPQGTVFASIRNGSEPHLEVRNREGQNLFDKYFIMKNQKLVVASAFVPAMLTLNQNSIRQDCLGYVLERVRHLPLSEHAIVDQRI